MKIISIEGIELKSGDVSLWVVAVTAFNFSTGEGVVVPFAFDTPEDSEDAVNLFSKIAELQGGELDEGNESGVFSPN